MEQNEIKIRRKADASGGLICRTHENGAVYLYSGVLEGTGIVRHAFSTRYGGVSKGCYATLNVSFTRGDDPDDVMENVRRMAEVVGALPEDVVCTHQTHTVNIRKVTADDRGKGVVRARDYTDIDGLITNERGIVLSCYFADCVPLLFIDPVKKAIGAAHAGWRGSVHDMAGHMVQAMRDAYGTSPKDLYAVIGPSVCGDCYEIGKEEGGRAFFLDLWALNRLLLKNAGVSEARIITTDICTRCNADLLFSHRVQGENRGNLAAFIRLV